MLEVLFFVIGAALGSFSLVLAWRLHDGKDWVRGRSECDACHKPLKPFDMIPILSWLMLKGKCRYCKKPISPQLLLAEVLMGLAVAASLAYWPFQLETAFGWAHFVLWVVILTVMSALFWFDFRWKELPTRLMHVLIGLAALEAVIELVATDSLDTTGLVRAISGGAIFAGIFYLIYVFSKGKMIGDGDIPLLFGLGLIAGSPVMAFLMVFIASILGTLITLPFLASKKLKTKSQIPFGPLLITATVIVQLFGDDIIARYSIFMGL